MTDRDMRRGRDGSFVSVDAARAEFAEALAGVELTAAEQRTVSWLIEMGDQGTLHNLVTIVAKLRRAGA
jgi:hypothetical protein